MDCSGVSGTGRVAEGVEFSDGWCALTWLTGRYSSVAFYPSIGAIEHIHGHRGNTSIVFGET